MANPDLTGVKNAVCLILGTVDNGGQSLNFKGTGFHYGNGWVMTVAHNFQDDANDRKDEHSVLSSGHFRVLFDIDGSKYEFGERRRMAFVHHLQPGEYPDFKNKDIAMVKLGIQYEYGRPKSNYSDWEKTERDMLQNMNSGNSYGLAQVDSPEPAEGDDVDAVHYGGDNQKKHEQVKIKKITAGKMYCKKTIPMLHLEKKAGVLAAGASGCPVMLKKDGKYYLVGLHFSGDDDEEDGEAEALPWNTGIQEYIQKGVRIIHNIGSYKAYAALSNLPSDLQEVANNTTESEKNRLKTKAKEANSTIYFPNCEVIKMENVEETPDTA